MPYSSEIVARARARLEQARSQREAENEAHLQTAYARYPRLRDIDRELRVTMAEVARETFRGAEDRAQKIAALRAKNQALQKERAWLLESSDLEEGYLDDSPICPICGGTGYVGSQMCECLAELCRQEQKKELTALVGAGRETFDNFRLTYYSADTDPRLGVSPRIIMTNTLAACRRYAQTFSRQSGNLLFSGDTGLGKTFLSGCIARAVADSGHSVVYASAPHLFQNLELARFRPNEEEARREAARYSACDLLIIDDLGTEMVNQFTVSALYTLINDRLMGTLPTIISTNLNSEDLERRYSPQISSRLMGSYRRLAFVGSDVRLQKARES